MENNNSEPQDRARFEDLDLKNGKILHNQLRSLIWVNKNLVHRFAVNCYSHNYVYWFNYGEERIILQCDTSHLSNETKYSIFRGTIAQGKALLYNLLANGIYNLCYELELLKLNKEIV